mgnify:CR=1 FL=1
MGGGKSSGSQSNQVQLTPEQQETLRIQNQALKETFLPAYQKTVGGAQDVLGQVMPAATQAANTAGAAATGGTSAAQGANFIENIKSKFAPLAAKVAPVLNNPVVRTAGDISTGAIPLQLLHGASNQAETANMNQPGANLFASTARGGKSFADWANEYFGQNKKYEQLRQKQREGLTQ